MAKIVKGGEQPASQINIEGVDFYKVDLDNEWTLKHDIIAKPIIAKVWNAIGDSNLTTESSLSDIGTVFKMQSKLMELGIEIELIALLYRYEKERKFDAEKYAKKKEIFEGMNLKQYDSMKGVIKDFFTSRGKSILADSQIYITGIQ